MAYRVLPAGGAWSRSDGGAVSSAAAAADGSPGAAHLMARWRFVSNERHQEGR